MARLEKNSSAKIFCILLICTICTSLSLMAVFVSAEDPMNKVSYNCPDKANTPTNIKEEIKSDFVGFIRYPASSQYTIGDISDMITFYNNNKADYSTANCKTYIGRTGDSMGEIITKKSGCGDGICTDDDVDFCRVKDCPALTIIDMKSEITRQNVALSLLTARYGASNTENLRIKSNSVLVSGQYQDKGWLNFLIQNSLIYELVGNELSGKPEVLSAYPGFTIDYNAGLQQFNYDVSKNMYENITLSWDNMTKTLDSLSTK